MGSAILRSNGEDEARVHAWITVPARRVAPPLCEERIVLTHPRRTASISWPPKSSGPRNPEQKVWSGPKPPGIELPDGRPIMKSQRIWIDPELLIQWDLEEAERRGGAR